MNGAAPANPRFLRVLAVCLLFVAMACAATPLAAQSVRYVYVEHDHYITGFRINDSLASLTVVPGSPLDMRLIGGYLESDPQGRFLFATNQNNDGVSVFRIDPATGALSEVAGSPFLNTGIPRRFGLAVERNGKYLYAVHDTTPYTIDCLVIDQATGALTLASTLPLDPGFSVPGDPLPEKSADRLQVVGNVGSTDGRIYTYIIDPLTGTLTQSNMTLVGQQVWSMALSSQGTRYVGYGNTRGFVNLFDTNRSSDFPVAMILTPDDSHLYVSFGFSKLRGFVVSNGTLSELPASPFYTDENSAMTADPGGPFAYVIRGNVSPFALHMFRITDTGGLLEAAGSPYPLSGLVWAVVVATPAAAQPMTLAPNALSFGPQLVGTSSTAKAVTLSNNGTISLDTGSISIAGPNSADFSLTHNCPATLLPSAGCEVDVTFQPTAGGARYANLVFANGAANSPQAVPLDGVGLDMFPAITTQPTGQSAGIGQTATFTVVATGSAPLTYRWQKNNVPIPGATSASYTTPPATINDDGATYKVGVSNHLGGVASNVVTLSVPHTSASITTQPVGVTISAGQTATFTVVGAGTTPLIYQWRKNNISIPGATSPSYTTPPAALADNGARYAVSVSNSFSGAPSNVVTLNVAGAATVPPAITTQPASQSVGIGQTATFTVVATGDGTLTYQWKKNNVSIPGATSASYTTPPATINDDGATYRVGIQNNLGGVASSVATLSVPHASASITTQPVGVTVSAGQTATLTVVGAGTGPLIYQWRKNNISIPGATSASYTTPPATLADDGTQYQVSVSNSFSGVPSNVVIVHVGP